MVLGVLLSPSGRFTLHYTAAVHSCYHLGQRVELGHCAPYSPALYSTTLEAALAALVVK